MKMERRDFLLWMGGIAFSLGSAEKEKCDLLKVLFSIYREVKEMGCRPGEDFLKREFHLELDGKRENREEHILVLIHNEGNIEKFILQVTFFKSRANYYFTRNAESIRNITCVVNGDAIDVIENELKEEELNILLPKILKGIQEEKKLLKLN